ncbi:hypothetical protein HD554DRAFT_107326 [Boletus coccyginus]|nr:hypothetical protein HD554DRAFT_107326 [Boletus coccyginus]
MMILQPARSRGPGYPLFPPLVHPSSVAAIHPVSSLAPNAQYSMLNHANKKRARDPIISDTRASSSLSPAPDDSDHPPPRVKKRTSKRAETRPCPACSELIPIRLLAAHAELELQRVEDIIKHIGDAEVLAEVDDLEEGPSANKRRSALKARQSLTVLRPLPRIRASSSSPSVTILANTNTTPTAIERAIGYITRRRKARHARLRELAKEEATWLSRHSAGDVDPEGETAGVVCPVCLQPVRGDRDVVEAHVDACLAYESRRAQVEREHERMIGLVRGNEDANVDVDIDTGWDREGSVRTRVITNASLRGTGIHIRPSTMDTEDDIDIDGTDDAVFGGAQFGEADVLKVESEADVDGVENVDQLSNHDRQTQAATPTDASSLSRPRGSDEDMDKLDLAILIARSRGDNLALVAALEAKLNATPAPATCRICLSPHVDPTVSTGCWHTCCATCWLRCLGATGLCPMCQRITGASELRRVYL